MTPFHGLSAFPITPADADGRVETDALLRLLARLAEAGVDSVGLLGSTGTYVYLSRAERRRAVEAAAEVLGGRTALVVGVGALRTDDAAALARDAADAGADGLLLAPVSYTPLTEAEVYDHFAAVARAGDRPLAIYDNPGTTHFTFTPDLLARLGTLPQVAGLKTPAPVDDPAGELAALRARLPADFALGVSVDWHAAGALLAGADAWYSVIGGLLPEPALALQRVAARGDAAETARLDARFRPLWELFRERSSLRVVYAAANLLSLTDAQPPRPILPLDARDRDRVAAALDALAADPA